MKTLISEIFNKYEIKFTENMIEQLNTYYEYVIEENKKYNLTAITDREEFAYKHILDCSLAIKYLPQNASVLDVGAGAGFPSIIIKILRPDINIVMLDSLNKRVNFLNSVVDILKLDSAKAVHSRAEDYAKEKRESFDIVIARAVANMQTLSEYCLPFVKLGGKFIAMKGSSFSEELALSEFAIKELGGKVKCINEYNLDEIEGVRAIIEVDKVSKTPSRYPRGKNLPRVKPLA